MKFTKIADGFRCSFVAVQSDGTLRTGLVAGDFVATVVNPQNNASTTPTVTESFKAGAYYFDVLSSFLQTHGAGEYGVTVEIDTVAGPSSTPHVRDVMHDVLGVTVEDFDDGYDGRVWFGGQGASAGSVVGVNGTRRNPSNTAADAESIALTLNYRHFMLAGAYGITQDLPGWTFEGIHGAAASLTLDGVSSIDNAKLLDVQVAGAFAAGDQNLQGDLVTFSSVTAIPTGLYRDCQFVGANTLVGGGSWGFQNCRTFAIPGVLPASLSAAGLTNGAVVSFVELQGSLTLKGLDQANSHYVVNLAGGHLTLDSDNTFGTITITGHGTVTDNSGVNCTVNTTDLLDVTSLVSDITNIEAIVELIRKVSENRLEVDISGSRLVLYDDNGTTELRSWPLETTGGEPVTTTNGVQTKRKVSTI